MAKRLTNNERKAIYRRDHYRCAICDGTNGLQIHHYVHRGQGGTNRPENLVTLCSVCHMQAHGLQPYNEVQTTKEEMEQYICEYLADMYAPDWYPDGLDKIFKRE